METGRPLSPNAAAARDVAVRLLMTEGASWGSPSYAVAQAAGRVLQRMQHTLVRWFGADGFQALLSRALDRSRDVCPPLYAVELPSPTRVSGVSISADSFAALRSFSPEEAMDACTTAIAEVITLLASLVGADMAMRLLEYAWPGERSGPDHVSPERTRE